jgi:hypothetical protein
VPAALRSAHRHVGVQGPAAAEAPTTRCFPPLFPCAQAATIATGAPDLLVVGGNGTAGVGAAAGGVSVAAVGESSFNLTFSLDRLGTLNFLVLYASMMVRYTDTFVAFDNAPGDPEALLATDLAAFSGGVVARGSCAAAAAGAATTCRIGPEPGGDEAPGAFACSPAASCKVQNTCFGSLCDFSRYAIVANTTYKVGGGVGGLRFWGARPPPRPPDRRRRLSGGRSDSEGSHRLALPRLLLLLFHLKRIAPAPT